MAQITEAEKADAAAALALVDAKIDVLKAELDQLGNAVQGGQVMISMAQIGDVAGAYAAVGVEIARTIQAVSFNAGDD